MTDAWQRAKTTEHSGAQESKQVYRISHDFTKSLQPFYHVKGIHTTIPADNFFP